MCVYNKVSFFSGHTVWIFLFYPGNLLNQPRYQASRLQAKLEDLHQQRGRQYQATSVQLAGDRIRLANVLIETLERAEDYDAGSFFIKPIGTVKPTKYVFIVLSMSKDVGSLPKISC